MRTAFLDVVGGLGFEFKFDFDDRLVTASHFSSFLHWLPEQASGFKERLSNGLVTFGREHPLDGNHAIYFAVSEPNLPTQEQLRTLRREVEHLKTMYCSRELSPEEEATHTEPHYPLGLADPNPIGFVG